MLRPSRRELLRTSALGFGWLALADLLAAAEPPRAAAPRDPLAPRPPHFPPKAKRVIFLFMHGGPSQVDTFDYKPLLDARRRQAAAVRQAARRVQRRPATCSARRWQFKQHGQSGAWVSELFPHVGRVRRRPLLHPLDARLELAARRGAAGTAHRQRHVRPAEHGVVDHLRPGHREPATCPASSPSARRSTHGGVQQLDARPSCPPSTRARRSATPASPSEQATIPFIRTPTTPRDLQRLELDLLARDEPRAPGRSRARPGAGGPHQLVRAGLPHAGRRPGAAGPLRRDAGDARSSTASTTPATDNFGRQCLMARRFAERGVRFVQVTHSYKWDQHGNLKTRPRQQRPRGRQADRRPADRPEAPRAAGGHAGAVGRRVRPHADGPGQRRPRPQPARLHHVAGRRRREGRASPTARPTTTATTRSRTRSTSTTCTRRSCTCSASTTTKLTYRYAGRDFRLTDVHGEVVQESSPEWPTGETRMQAEAQEVRDRSRRRDALDALDFFGFQVEIEDAQGRSACGPASVVPVRGTMPTSRANRKTIWLTVRRWRVAIRANSGWASASRLAVSSEKPW